MQSSRRGLRSRVAAGVGAMAAVVAFSAGVNPAAAQAEDNFFPFCSQADRVCVEGPQVSGHTGSEFCEWDPNGSAHPNASVCVDKANDIVWVRDTEPDGRSAMGYVLDGGVWWICRNKHGAGSWARCDFDWPENRSYDLFMGDWNFSAGTGTDLWYLRSFND